MSSATMFFSDRPVGGIVAFDFSLKLPNVALFNF